MTENEQTQCPLFKLPSEIRNSVYEHASVTHDSHREPSIFHTCRRIHNKGIKLFHATHPFRFDATKILLRQCKATAYHHILTSIGADKMAMIEHLIFDVKGKADTYTTEDKKDKSIFFTVHAKEPQILETCFLLEDVRADDIRSLKADRRAINRL